MPPVAPRPPSDYRPRQSTPPRPRRDETDRVRTGGLAAVRERRERRYSRDPVNTRGQALDDLLATGQSYRPQSAVYDEWLGETSPQDYPVVFGRSDEGDYAGYRTRSDLTDAIRGQAEMLRDQDRDRFAQMYDQSNQYLDDIEGEYRTANEAAYDGAFGGAYEFFPGMPKPQHLVDYQDDLGQWAETTADPYLDNLELAEVGSRTPLQEYGLRAAAQFGVAPEIARGMYNDADAIGQYEDDRDMASIDAYGMPYSEYQSALADLEAEYEAAIEAQDEQAAASYEAEIAAAEDALSAEVFQRTGYDVGQLAERSDLTPEQASAIVLSEDFTAYEQPILEALAADDPDAIADAVTAVLSDARLYNPAYYNVLATIYGDLAG